jgi:hypothetical protein
MPGAPSPLFTLGLLALGLAPPAAAEGPGEQEPQETAGADLPDALPPLDDWLVAEAPPPPLRFFVQARSRGELDESRDLSRVEDASAGVALTGRVGIDASLEGARLVVVLADGARVGQPTSAPLLVPRPALPVLWQAELAVDLEVFGLPGALSFGRMPVVVGDGRLVGVEPFDPRGRTLDGARLRAQGALVEAEAGAFWLGPADERAPGSLSGFAFLEMSTRGERLSSLELDVDGFGLLHRDGERGLTVPTIGVHLAAHAVLPPSLWSSELGARAGVDVQAPLVDGSGAFAPAGTAARAQGALRATARLSSWSPRAPDPFLDLSAEITTGDVVAGRVLHAPAPTQHGFLGLLDLVAADNTWSTALRAGALARRGLAFDVTGRIVGIVDGRGPLLDPGGKAVPQRVGRGVALVELDARLELPLTRDVALGAAWGLALPGAALIGDHPAQRLLVTLRAQASSDEGGRGRPRREQPPHRGAKAD